MLPIKPDTGSVQTLFPSDILEQASDYDDQSFVKVVRIKEAASGKGYAFFSEILSDPNIEDDFEVMDFCWKNSKLGKTVQAIFKDPKIADDTEIFLAIQIKAKSAVVKSEESKGSFWENDEPGELNFTENPNSVLEGLQAKLGAPPTEPPVSPLHSPAESSPETQPLPEDPQTGRRRGAKG